MKLSRRQFVKAASAVGVTLASGAGQPQPGASPQPAPGDFGVLVRDTDATNGDYPDPAVVQTMVDGAIRRWTGLVDIGQAWESIFTRGVDTSTKICIKINVQDLSYTDYPGGTREGAASSPEVVNAIVAGLTQMLGGTYPASNVTVYDRHDVRYLERCHFKDGAMPYPYSVHVSTAYSKNIDVHDKTTQICDVVDQSDYVINVPVIKDHHIAGASFSMKNHYGSVSTPSELHRWACRPYLPRLQLASWTDFFGNQASLQAKTAVIVVDALYGLYNGGPEDGPFFVGNTILMAKDMVGVDAKCLEILNEVRASQNPSLPAIAGEWITESETLGLGTASLSWVDLGPPVLQVRANPVDGGTVMKNPDQPSYPSGTPVELTALPAAGYTFDHWEGDASGSDNPTTVVMDASKSITAVFREIHSGISDWQLY